MRSLKLVFIMALLAPIAVVAGGDADVLAVEVKRTAQQTWTFIVTVQHPDTGWQDYVDGWDVVLPDGTVVRPSQGEAFTRTLWHPHVNEQPFTRSQSGIRIPDGINEVVVRAHDIKDGFGGREHRVSLP